MKILITGGTGVIGRGVIPELLADGHQLRLLSRSASETAGEWPGGVECRDGDVADAGSLDGAAAGCQAVLHITGIVDESPPHVTFEKVNVEGTRNVVQEAARSGVRRFVFVSSLGADRGKSPYHQSKLQAEQEVARFPREWVITRPGHVFGPGDEMISTVLKMVRTSPVVPEVGMGQHQFQPLWFRDYGRALKECLSRPDLAGQRLDIAGGDVLTVHDLLRSLSRLTYRPAFPLPLPAFLVRGAVWTFERVRRFLPRGAALPLNESKLTMLVEENLIPSGGVNALVDVLHLEPTPIQEALRELVDLVPENPPETGVGSLEHKQFWIDLSGTQLDAEGLLTLFKTQITEIMPIDFSAEPGAPRVVEYGATLSARLPGRGNIQVRVQESEPHRVTFATIEGHPLAGIVTFTAEPRGGGVRFRVDTWSRPANSLDWLAINMAGRWFQDLTWQTVVENVARLSGGSSPEGVQQKAETLGDDEAKQVEQWAKDLIARRKRDELEEAEARSAS
jgi:uncharacterized protein YbjT (DUF2867 family)